MIYALGQWIGMDKFKIKEVPTTNDKPISPDDFKVHPILRTKALEILQKSGKR